MSKRPNIPAGFDWATAEAAIIDEINDCVPNNAGCKDPAKVLAKEILYFWRSPALAPSNRFPEDERKKIKELRKAARQLGTVFNSLDPEIQLVLRKAAAASGGFTGKSGWTTASEKEILLFLRFGPELLERLSKDIEKTIPKERGSAKQNFAEIRLVEHCANIWEWRTGKRPKSERSGRFVLFVTGVFHAIGIDKSAKSTIRAWSKM